MSRNCGALWKVDCSSTPSCGTTSDESRVVTTNPIAAERNPRTRTSRLRSPNASQVPLIPNPSRAIEAMK